jgi:hypothetical protein
LSGKLPCAATAWGLRKCYAQSWQNWHGYPISGFLEGILTATLNHHLWNGNVGKAQTLIDVLKLQLEGERIGMERKKLLKAVQDFAGYIFANAEFIPDYGDRYRNEETITTAFVESAVNQVVSKRMVKKQPMRWSKKGAHLLLQVRTQVLNDELLETFREWYPGMNPGQIVEQRAA